MPNRKDILKAILKSLLAGAETSAWVKIPATFIAEIASLSKEQRDSLGESASVEQFEELLTQTELATSNAALAAAGAEQIKKMVSELNTLSDAKLKALTKITQDEFDEIAGKLNIIDVTTKKTLEIVDKMAKNLEVEPKIKEAIKKICLAILEKEDFPEWQWPEKLREIADRHQELLAKWKTIQSGDPKVDTLRDNARRMIENGEYDQADQLLQEAIEIDREAIQSQQEKMDQRKLSLAQSLAHRADLAETRLEYNSAIDLYKAALDALPQEQHETQAIYLNNLGLLYDTVADYKNAEPLMRRALEIDEKSFGPDHPEVATDLNNLASLLQSTNRLDQAEPLMRRALVIDENSFGPNHPNIAIRLNNLAQLLQDTNRLAEAEPLMRRALEIDEKSFGPDHPNVAIRLSNLAQLLQDTNRLDEAEPLMKRVVGIFEKSYGKEHPNVATALNNLARLLKDTNRFDDAELMYRRALEIDEKSFGPDHPNVAIRLNNLASLLQATNRLAEAEPLMERHLGIFLQFTRCTGHNHPHLKDAINNFVGLLTQMGHSKEQITARLQHLDPEFFASTDN